MRESIKKIAEALSADSHYRELVAQVKEWDNIPLPALIEGSNTNLESDDLIYNMQRLKKRLLTILNYDNPAEDVHQTSYVAVYQALLHLREFFPSAQEPTTKRDIYLAASQAAAAKSNSQAINILVTGSLLTIAVTFMLTSFSILPFIVAAAGALITLTLLAVKPGYHSFYEQEMKKLLDKYEKMIINKADLEGDNVNLYERIPEGELKPTSSLESKPNLSSQRKIAKQIRGNSPAITRAGTPALSSNTSPAVEITPFAHHLFKQRRGSLNEPDEAFPIHGQCYTSEFENFSNSP